MPFVEPLSQLGRRMPEQGRIRIGRQVPTKGGKTRPEKLETLRFTSRDQQAVEQIAACYGGECRVWDGAPGTGRQWEVVTKRSEIPVILPPNCLGGTPIYEEWSRGGCTRRCDGELMDQAQTGPDGAEMTKVPCLCSTESGPRRCKIKTRLTLILADVRFGGGWRLETGSEHAAREIPGMVEMIQALQSKGLEPARLRLDPRTSVKAGKTQHYVIPVLALDTSLTDIQNGTAVSAPQLSAPTVAELEEATVVDLVDDMTLDQITLYSDEIANAWNLTHPEGPVSGRQLAQLLASQLTTRPNQQVHALTLAQATKLLDLLGEIVGGTVTITSIQNNRVGVSR